MSVVPIATNVLAGPFTAKWKIGNTGTDLDLGIIGAKGITETLQLVGEDISSSLLGDSIIDSVNIGGHCFLEFDLEEADSQAAMAISHPHIQGTSGAAAALNTMLGKEGNLPIPGTMATDNFGSLVLTPAFSTNNAAGNQATPIRTYGVCRLAPGFELPKLLHARRRLVPVRLRAFPYLNGTDYVFYTKS